MYVFYVALSKDYRFELSTKSLADSLEYREENVDVKKKLRMS